MIICSSCKTEIDKNTENCPNCGNKCFQEVEVLPEDEHENKRKDKQENKDEDKHEKSSLPLVKRAFFAIGGLAACLALAMLIVLNPFKTGKIKPSVYYIKDNEINFTYLSSIKPLELTDKLLDSNYSVDTETLTYALNYLFSYHPIFLSNNGRYIFYLDRITDNDTATLYCRDLKNHNTMSEAIKIDSEISLLSQIQLSDDDSRIFYIKNDGRFYYFDMNEKFKIDNNVTNYYINQSGDYIMYINEEGTIYERELKNNSTKDKIDNDSFIWNAADDLSKVYYTKDSSLYIKERNKSKVKIASNVSRVISVIDKVGIYYTKEEPVKYKLTDYVIDDFADSDSHIIEPVPPDFADYQTSVLVDDYWFGEYWATETDWDSYHIAEELYYIALEEYNEKLYRDDVREELSNEEIVHYNEILYFYDGTSEEKIAEDIYDIPDVSNQNAIVVYRKYKKPTIEKVKLSQISFLSDVSSMIYEALIVDEKNFYLACKTTETNIDQTNASFFNINDKGTRLYYLDDYKEYGTLMYIGMETDSISSPVKVDDDVCCFRIANKNDSLIYFKDIKNGSGDLYSDTKFIASDVYTFSVYTFRDSSSLAYFTDYSEINHNGTLNLYNNGKTKRIADDVFSFVVENKNNIVYLVDYNMDKLKGDAMLYNGSDKPLIVDTDVTMLIWKDGAGDYLWYYYNNPPSDDSY